MESEWDRLLCSQFPVSQYPQFHVILVTCHATRTRLSSNISTMTAFKSTYTIPKELTVITTIQFYDAHIGVNIWEIQLS